MSAFQRLASLPAARWAVNLPLFGNRRRLRGQRNRLTGLSKSLWIKSRVRVEGNGNLITLGDVVLRGVSIFIKGSGNTVRIGDGGRLLNTTLWILADNATINLAGENIINNCEIGVEGNGGRVLCGHDASIGGFVWLDGRANSTETARLYAGSETITVEDGSRVSDGVTIRTTDSHDILTLSGEVVNRPADVRIGRHAWIASGAMLLKGAGVGDDCIVGARSLVTRDFSQLPNVILAGSPAKAVREGITWRL